MQQPFKRLTFKRGGGRVAHLLEAEAEGDVVGKSVLAAAEKRRLVRADVYPRLQNRRYGKDAMQIVGGARVLAVEVGELLEHGAGVGRLAVHVVEHAAEHEVTRRHGHKLAPHAALALQAPLPARHPQLVEEQHDRVVAAGHAVVLAVEVADDERRARARALARGIGKRHHHDIGRLGALGRIGGMAHDGRGVCHLLEQV